MSTTRDVIIRGVAVPIQAELLYALRAQSETGAAPHRRSIFILGEDASDVMGAGESGWDVDHPSVATLQLGLVGRQAIVVSRPYVTPLLALTARDVDLLNLDGLAGLELDPARLAGKLVDPEYAPRLKTLIIEGERDAALDACAAKRGLTVVYRCAPVACACVLIIAVRCCARRPAQPSFPTSERWWRLASTWPCCIVSSFLLSRALRPLGQKRVWATRRIRLRVVARSLTLLERVCTLWTRRLSAPEHAPARSRRVNVAAHRPRSRCQDGAGQADAAG